MAVDIFQNNVFYKNSLLNKIENNCSFRELDFHFTRMNKKKIIHSPFISQLCDPILDTVVGHYFQFNGRIGERSQDGIIDE
jgi:hypothetical protein